MTNYIDRIMSIAEQLVAIGKPLDDETVGGIILGGLPVEFRPLILGIQGSNQKISFEFVKSLLLQTNVKDFAVASGNYTSCAYVTRRQSEKKSEHSELKCFGRKQIGQVKAKCPYRLRKDRSFAQRKKSGKQSRAIINFAASCLYGSKGFESIDDWFLDCGATAHLSRRNDWLEKSSKNSIIGIRRGEQ
ncbi:hypothetical protein M513_13009 [Trichuris suis]|uniref:Retrovirus-related Pol polyprotein from transposon TNT 1-94 n=1 Tax=Trichuris suis TaxID=68888 RepID=A0A085LMB8_9BILA|nr:hypothetical protein M513_13009 [Trichuris suis]